MTDAVLTTVAGPILQITLNRPQVLNAVDRELALGLHAAVERLERTPSLIVGVVHGAGRAFCAGNDLKNFGRGPEFSPMTDRGFAGMTERTPAKVTIAAVEGHAAGGGFEIALACDLIVAGESARFALPEVKRGLLAGGGGILRLPRRIPRAVAAEALFTGEPLDARRLADLGLVSRVVPDGQALDAAMRLARKIAECSPVALGATKRILDESEDWPVGEFFERQRPILHSVTRSADAAEGAAAFNERRAPDWPSLREPA
ncbi:enoyl-CoA hydratase [Thermocatellispora tengchongensis]|uniref:Enoyl-CoA hydratase n=1 Tax=Thermocatellispora tengchongensis TaxID=1073253 RepID=A0A840PG74_9ACTN|nr:crotonase/enoyl-CoA hydratase family protein [Thermocatellispora tengchongensis]MBB5136841.1 enoyl-CoA hydratase [Thermocatellispora tengchongensis]